MLNFTPMGALREITGFKSISWLLVTAILLMTLLPAHYHLHHSDSTVTSTHSHAVDLHLTADKAGQSHHDEDAPVFSATPDGIVKTSNPEIFPFILLAVALVLSPLTKKRIRIKPYKITSGIKQSFPHFSPPLRAPPLL